jgi:hypothetical protein
MNRDWLKRLLGTLRDRAEDVASFLVDPVETLERRRKKDRRNGL